MRKWRYNFSGFGGPVRAGGAAIGRSIATFSAVRNETGAGIGAE